MATLDVCDAQADLSLLIARAEAGEEILIAREGTPVARLTPVLPLVQRGPRQPGSWKGRITIDDRFFEPLPEEELAAWDGSAPTGSASH